MTRANSALPAAPQTKLAHDARMPVACKAFVHRLRLHLRDEVFHLLVEHSHRVALPVLKRGRVAHDVIDDIFFGEPVAAWPLVLSARAFGFGPFPYVP